MEVKIIKEGGRFPDIKGTPTRIKLWGTKEQDGFYDGKVDIRLSEKALKRPTILALVHHVITDTDPEVMTSVAYTHDQLLDIIDIILQAEHINNQPEGFLLSGILSLHDKHKKIYKDRE